MKQPAPKTHTNVKPYHLRHLLTAIALLTALFVKAQNPASATDTLRADSTNAAKMLPAGLFYPDDTPINELMHPLMRPGTDTLVTQKTKVQRQKRDWATWRPDPKRAMWLAIVIPGAGQIYNRKFWKLPIVYGGFVGCAYAMRWNNMMYHDYSQAYLDIMDSDPNTQSYNQFLHLGSRITSTNEEHFKEVFRKRKDFYRRYRDMSFFVLVGVYAISVIDAYVDASLSQFDISNDLTLHLAPTIINGTADHPGTLHQTALGLQCSINF